MNLKIKDINGQEQGDLEIKFSLIEDGRGTQAVHDVVVAHRAAKRSGTACTKTMGEVQGSGKKPWRQKGTGRARAGSLRSPLWRGGGVVFGPKPRDYTKKVSKTSRQLALRKALSERIKAGDVTVVSALELESAKTKGLVKVLHDIGLQGTILVVAEEASQNLLLAARNIPNVAVTTGREVHSYDILKYDRLLFTQSAFEKIEQRLVK